MPITNYYVASDGMGSVTAIIDEDGNVLERRSYDAFGDMSCMLPDGTPVANSPTGVDVGFQGQIRDEVTGLSQMGFRWYSPALGRWLSRDPIGLAGGLNLNIALDNNPLSALDLWGNEAYAITSDGKVQMLGSSKDLLHFMLCAKDDSIIRLEISGHGTERDQSLDAYNEESSERLFSAVYTDPVSGKSSMELYLGGADFKPEDCGRVKVSKNPDGSMDADIGGLLNRKMAKGSRIYLFGCHSGGRNESCATPECRRKCPISIAETVSKKISKSEVFASTLPTIRMRNLFMRYTSEIRWSHVNRFKNGAQQYHETTNSTYILGEK